MIDMGLPFGKQELIINKMVKQQKIKYRVIIYMQLTFIIGETKWLKSENQI